MIKFIEFGDQQISYTLKRSKRKSLGIEVNSEGQLIVTAPDYVSIDKIDWALGKKQTWILDKIKEKSDNLNLQPKRKYISGESIYLFGKQLYLKVIEADTGSITLADDQLTANVASNDNAAILIENWIAEKLQHRVNQQFDVCFDKFKDLYECNHKPTVKIKPMKKRWGSCSAKGEISLNLKLYAASPECIDYIIYHELTHLVYPNHSDEFYFALKRLCPNYRKLKEKLDQTVIYN